MIDRRVLLKAAGYSSFSWLTPVAELLAVNPPNVTREAPAKSLILLWMAGGPSQLETFDPHPDHAIAGGTQAVPTSAPSVRIAAGLERTAEVMDHVMLLRSVVSREGDHERALYNVTTGFRPDPSLTHPSIGAVVCHQLPRGTTEIPRHVSILPERSPGRGGYLGADYDAFQIGDPQGPLPDMKPHGSEERLNQRLQDLTVVDREFAQGRRALPLNAKSNLQRARRMMTSSQLKAFDLREVPVAVTEPFGDTAFGRGCLAAARLIEVGVRCVEVTLPGWDSHVANHELQTDRKRILDPAFASLIAYLAERSLLQETLVVCAGEFGRTPIINPAGGRDHWPHGFSIAIAGGGVAGGTVIGETDPDGSRIRYDTGIPIADVHASLLHRLGVQPETEIETPIGRPIKLSEGRVVF